MKFFIYCRKSQEAEDRQIMSLESQAEEISRLIDGASDIEIVDRYEEAFSAKQPGRPLFDTMLERIEAGEAEGIIAWHPDRLARNSMDGGRIIHLLDQGAIKSLRFCNYAFENSSQGKFMLNIIFGYSKYYVDNLSENVKRGQRAKIRQGWRPNFAPTGYRNCADTGTIVPDPEHFEAIKAMFNLLLTGHYTVAQIHRIVRDDWGYVTPTVKTRGGKPLSRSALYRIFANPFYAGLFEWNGQLHVGKHEPIVSRVQFETVQRLIRQERTPRPKRRCFPFGGLLACGACGLSVTAEHKHKPSGREYTYYHCTRVHRSPKCEQPSIEERVLYRQAAEFLERVSIPTSCVDWFLKQIQDVGKPLKDQRVDSRRKHEDRLARLNRQRSNLIDIRTRELIPEEEFVSKCTELDVAIAQTAKNIAKSGNQPASFEPLEILQILRNKAVDWVEGAEPVIMRELLEILCSNPTLRDKNARFQARKPFIELDEIAECLGLRGDIDDVRTDQAIANRLLDLASDPETIALAEQSRAIIQQIAPEVLTSPCLRDALVPGAGKAIRRPPASYGP